MTIWNILKNCSEAIVKIYEKSAAKLKILMKYRGKLLPKVCKNPQQSENWIYAFTRIKSSSIGFIAFIQKQKYEIS